MGKRKTRRMNPEPFLPDGNQSVSSKKRSKPPKEHQNETQAHIVWYDCMRSKILKEALIQQKEIQEEEEGALRQQSDNPNIKSFVFVTEEPSKVEVDDMDDFAGFSETQSQFGDFEEEIDEEDEKLLEALLSKDTGRERTLADVIVKKIKENDANVFSEKRPFPKLDSSIIELYRGVGTLMSKYTAGKLPKAFKHIPSTQLWEDVLYFTEPENWSPNAIYQATRIFASNLGPKKAERFYKLVLLPRVRDDIRKNQRLHFALYQSLKKAVYKPAAFFKGILFPLCESRTCSLREAVIVGSILQKISIPPLHSSVALLKLAEMEYCGTTSYFIKLLVEKKYALPYRVLDGVVAHFMRILEETQITPEISRELNNSCDRGEKEDDLMLISSPISVIIKTIEEDRFDIPEIPMEED